MMSLARVKMAKMGSQRDIRTSIVIFRDLVEFFEGSL